MRVVPLNGLADSSAPDTPTTLGKYRILEKIGRGAMGVVYRARDPEIGRDVALKHLRSLRSDHPQDAAEAFKRFRLEARAAGNLRHPNIITVFDASQEGDHPFIVMEYITGEGLDRIIDREHRLAPARLLPILRQIGAGLDYAHERGVVHRDIKPSNILIDAHDHAFILDFGVASMIRRTGGIVSEQGSEPEEIVGTPAYMSPEQIKNETLSAKSDLFGFAALTFECLTGHIPFRGENATALMRQILASKRRPIGEVAPYLPAKLETIFDRAFALDPHARFENARSFVNAVDETISMSPLNTKSSPEIPLSFAGKATRRGGNASTIIAPHSSGNTAAAPSPWRERPSEIANEDMYAPRPAATPKKITPGSIFAGGEPSPMRKATGPSVAKRTIGRRRLDLRMLIGIFGGALLAPLLTFVIWGTMKPLFDTPTTPPDSRAAASTTVSELEPPRTEEANPGVPVHELNNRQILGILTRGTDSETRIVEALNAAGERRIAEFVNASVHPLRHSSYAVRLATIKLIGASGDRRIVPTLGLSLDDPEATVRAAAARALAQLGDRRALTLMLTQYANEPDEDVKAALKRAYEQLSGLPFPG